MQADRQPVAAVSVAGQWASCPPQPASSVCSAGAIETRPRAGPHPRPSLNANNARHMRELGVVHC